MRVYLVAYVDKADPEASFVESAFTTRQLAEARLAQLDRDGGSENEWRHSWSVQERAVLDALPVLVTRYNASQTAYPNGRVGELTVSDRDYWSHEAGQVEPSESEHWYDRTAGYFHARMPTREAAVASVERRVKAYLEARKEGQG